jgi:cytochrome c553
MTPIARELSDSDMQDVAAYYAEQSVTTRHAERIVDPQVLQRGGAISANGSARSGVPACVNCHGLAGAGLPPSFPYLAGQYAAYLELQLSLFARGERANDPLGVMRNLAARLSEEDIRALARYFESVPRRAETAADPKTKP